MSDSRKILFVLPSLHAGGAENYILRFVAFCESTFDITVLSVNESKGDLHDSFTKLGVTIRYQSVGFVHPFRWIKLFKFMSDGEFDVVCTMNGNFGGIPIFIAKLAGIKSRVACYRRSTNAFKTNFIKRCYNSGVRDLVRAHATAILSNSHAAFHNFFGENVYKDARFKVIRNGLDARVIMTDRMKNDCRLQYGIPLDSFIIGHIGRFDPAKNHATIFKVIKNVVEVDDTIFFVFCGKDTDSDHFVRTMRRHGVQKNCILLGLQHEIRLVLKSFDAFYFPSLTEGQPNALIEAMLADLPVVTSNIPAIKEVLPPSSHSLLVGPTDVAAACKVIFQLKDDETMRQQYRFKEWALEVFDYKRNMNSFKSELTK